MHGVHQADEDTWNLIERHRNFLRLFENFYVQQPDNCSEIAASEEEQKMNDTKRESDDKQPQQPTNQTRDKKSEKNKDNKNDEDDEEEGQKEDDSSGPLSRFVRWLRRSLGNPPTG